MLEKVHGSGVSQHMGADILSFERCAGSCSGCRIFSEKALDCVPTELPASDTEKQRILRLAVALAQPGVQHFYCFCTQRCTPLFSAFSQAVHMSAGSQEDILTTQTDQLGDSESGLHCE
jgi:hypothetical protein